MKIIRSRATKTKIRAMKSTKIRAKKTMRRVQIVRIKTPPIKAT